MSEAPVRFHNFEIFHCDISLLAFIPMPAGGNLLAAARVLFEECNLIFITWNGVTIRHSAVRLNKVTLRSPEGVGQNTGLRAVAVDLRMGAVATLEGCCVVGCGRTGYHFLVY